MRKQPSRSRGRQGCVSTSFAHPRLHSRSHRTGRGTRDAAGGTRRTHARTRPHEGTRKNASTPSSSVTVSHGTPATYSPSHHIHTPNPARAGNLRTAFFSQTPARVMQSGVQVTKTPLATPVADPTWLSILKLLTILSQVYTQVYDLNTAQPPAHAVSWSREIEYSSSSRPASPSCAWQGRCHA